MFIKDLGKSLLKVFIYFLLFSLFLTIIYYFNIINNKTFSYLRLIGFIIILYFTSIKENKFNIMNGLTLGLSIVTIFFLVTLIIGYKIDLRLIIYYFLIVGTTVLGSFKKKGKELKKFVKK